MIDEKFLEGIGITDKDTVQKITEAYAADIKAEQDAAAAVQTQLDEASKTIQSYKDMDIDGIKAWQTTSRSWSSPRQTVPHSSTAPSCPSMSRDCS